MILTAEDINIKEVLMYLGYKGGDVPSDLSTDIAVISEELLARLQIQTTYRLFSRTPDGIIDNLGFSLEGHDIHEMLHESHHVIIFGATLGAAIDRYLKRLQIVDVSKALIFDACANSAIESVCDKLCASFAESYGYTTDRFSPVYGDLPFSQQADLADALNLQKTIGVTLTDSGLMVPQKSVTAVLGIADRPQKKRFRGCSHCNLFHTCTLRKENKTCGRF